MAEIQILFERAHCWSRQTLLEIRLLELARNPHSRTYWKSTLWGTRESYSGRCLIRHTQLQNHLRQLLAAGCYDCHLCCRNCLACITEPGNKTLSSCNVFPVPSIDKALVTAGKGNYLKGPDPFSQSRQRGYIWNWETINKNSHIYCSIPLFWHILGAQ